MDRPPSIDERRAFTPTGLDLCICQVCGKKLSADRLAQSGHIRRSREHRAALRAQRAQP